MTAPPRPTASASAPANRPAPQYRSSATSPALGPSEPSTAAASASAAPGWTCQNAPAPTRQPRPAAASRRLPRPDSLVSPLPRPAARTVSARRPSFWTATVTARSPELGEATTSTARASRQFSRVTFAEFTSGWAIGESKRVDPVGRPHQDLGRLRPGELRGGFGDPGADALAGQRVPDKDHPAARVAGDAPAPVGHAGDAELEHRPGAGGRPPGGPGARASLPWR